VVTPLVHMGLGYDDLLVPALVHAGFDTKDLILVVRTDANLAWAQQHAPRATIVRLPYAAAKRANAVSGLTPHAALRRALEGVGLDVLDLLVSERALRRNRVDTAMNFLNLAAEEIESAIEGRGPILALTEFTVTSELLVAGLVTHHGGLAVWPRSVRLPADRFGLVGCPVGVTLFEREVDDPEARQAGAEFLRTWRDEQARPTGFAQNLRVESRQEIWRLASDRIREFALDRGSNLQLPKPSDYAKLPWLNPVKARLNLREYRSRRWDPIPDTFVFMPLHVQPESSVDVHGRLWRDQAYTAKVLADSLMEKDIVLAVKEHAHFMWRRDPDFWPQLDLHPNIACVDPIADSRDLAARAEFTVTATGTVGLENSLRGLATVTGAQMPWSHLGNVAHIPDPDDLPAFVASNGWDSLRESTARIDEWFVDHYVANTWKGLVLDPPREPAVLEPENIRSIGGAFAEAADSLRAREPRARVLR
jgi:hypothetical protein